MLARLHIRNYAIISELDIEIDNGLTIITGETGAGKSILIGALSLVLGKRADTSVLYNSKEKCVVEAFFNMEGYELQSFFDENDLDLEKTTILRREINAQGKSRAFINDTPVNLSQLKELADSLIDIHSQHEVLTLKTPEFRARFLDAYADGGKQFRAYQTVHAKWIELKNQVESLKMQLQEASADEDYLRFQLNELQELNLKEGELQSGQERLTLLENAEEIQRTMSEISDAFVNSDVALIDSLRRVEASLRNLARKHSPSLELANRVRSCMIELEDIAEEIDRNTGELNEDPEELATLQERVDEILRLMTKHRKQSENDLIQLQEELEAKLDTIGTSDEQLTLASAELERAESELTKQADLLTKLRTEAATKVSPVVMKQLHELGMPDAFLQITIDQTNKSTLGQDRIDIRFTANKGQEPQDISKVASGGELSRLMLSVKSEIANTTKLPAIIFDEIDTGVSGDVANKVGQKIKELSSRMQVLCITHLPQIASKADQHLFVYKEEQEGRTTTGVKHLQKEDRILEIAKMLSSANPTEAALTHAKNMVEETTI